MTDLDRNAGWPELFGAVPVVTPVFSALRIFEQVNVSAGAAKATMFRKTIRWIRQN
jgi:hypothetical protein